MVPCPGYPMNSPTLECPNHRGAYDCTPFCRICEGEQETNNRKETMTKRTPNPYNLVVGLLLAAVMVAAAIEPPTAYLVPLIVVAWLVVFWSYQRETRPRYRRH